MASGTQAVVRDPINAKSYVFSRVPIRVPRAGSAHLAGDFVIAGQFAFDGLRNPGAECKLTALAVSRSLHGEILSQGPRDVAAQHTKTVALSVPRCGILAAASRGSFS